MTKIIVPLFIRLAKSEDGKKYRLNLNYYRNWYYTQSNAIKRKFCEILESELEGIKFTDKIKIRFVLFKGSNRKIDRSNVLSVVEKFFCDALVHYGCIVDDNDEYIESTHYYTGGIDRDDPRVEITILTKKSKML